MLTETQCTQIDKNTKKMVCPPSNIQTYSAVLLTAVTTRYTAFPRTCLETGNMCPLTPFAHFAHSTFRPPAQAPLAITGLLSERMRSLLCSTYT